MVKSSLSNDEDDATGGMVSEHLVLPLLEVHRMAEGMLYRKKASWRSRPANSI